MRASVNRMIVAIGITTATLCGPVPICAAERSRDTKPQRRAVEEQIANLQRQRRHAQFTFTQEYVTRLRQQEIKLRNRKEHSYRKDPYFYTPADYRYSWDGQHFETNRYGVILLRQALNNGYREGWRAGMADRIDHWPYSYRDCLAYGDANYGYDGYYLDRATYNHYFREGFQRGYDDGYYNDHRYGSYVHGNGSLSESLVTVVLHLQSIR